MCRVRSKKRGVPRVVRWGLSMRIILVFTMLSNLFIVDEDLVRTRPVGGYRREHCIYWDIMVFSDKHKKC